MSREVAGSCLQGAGGGVGTVDEDGVGGVAGADDVVGDVVDEAAARGVGLDADAGVAAGRGRGWEMRISLTPPLVS